jgi:hypothetical protein
MNDVVEQQGTRPAWASLRWRIAAAAGLFLLGVVATIRVASASFDGSGAPVADAGAQDEILSGTVRMMGDRVALYSGTSLESISKRVSVNFARGGSLVLCPHTQMQILKATQNARMLLAFQAGGSAEPFPLRTGDEIITPDWRIDFGSEERQGDIGTLQVSTTRRGDLCLDSNSQSGAYFRVSQMAGDASFQVVGQTTARFSDGKMMNASGGCACNVAPEPEESASLAASSAFPASLASAVASPRTDVASAALAASPTANVESRPAPAMAAGNGAKARRPVADRQRPQDVAGYVRSFVHLIFGR